MCGISGIISKNHKDISRFKLEEMTDCIKHRGPDGYDYFYDKSIGLGHRRLSILDLSDAGKQPMARADRWTMVFNGEIYNYIELRDELKNYGFDFTTETDSEVILAAYEHWGENCVNKFNGMWALAIYDRVAQTVFCSRDRFGVKPFYFTENQELFAFGSEIRQLLPFLERRKVNKDVLINYLVLGLENYAESTFFENVQELRPAHNLVYMLKTHEKKIYPYYTISIDKKLAKLNLEQSLDVWLTEFTRSVKYRLRSDVEVGTCLSGGLDSSAVAAIASELNKQNGGFDFSAFTAQSVDPERDETAYAQKVVEFCHLKWHTIKPNTIDFIKVLDEVVETQEEPFGSPSIVMQYFVMKLAHDAGIKVLLDGQGGDETLLGYERYFPAYFMLDNLVKIPGRLLSASKHSKLNIPKLFLYQFYFTSSKLRLYRQKNRWRCLKKVHLKHVNNELIERISESYKNIQNLQITELTTTQLPHLLKYEDRNSMHFSIETRLPFLDYKLVETSLSLNNDFKINKGWTKFVLREALRFKLPEDILWRKKKIGFEAPMTSWLENKKHFYSEIQSSRFLKYIIDASKVNFSDDLMIWKLYVIARWSEIFNVEFD